MGAGGWLRGRGIVLGDMARDGIADARHLRDLLQVCRSRTLADQVLRVVLPSLLVAPTDRRASVPSTHAEVLPYEIRSLLGQVHRQSSLPDMSAAEFERTVTSLNLPSLGLPGVFAELDLVMAQTKIKDGQPVAWS